ncbi:hypothetical protein IC007_2556 [Sulfuracidifex tepidarius]|uniref:Uncharacterized protein n=1 Tax=Sulfuracidifex tepidarius TaxID=1294262 RepID=A0A510E635_9CREN|nr:hypothetical protein IC007_2556 [Sulfuracidifex tepidarius]
MGEIVKSTEIEGLVFERNHFFLIPVKEAGFSYLQKVHYLPL